MLRWAAIALLATAVVVVARWGLRRVDALGRTRDFPWIAAGLPLVLAVAAFVPVVRHGREERRLSEVASTLVGAPVRVHCQSGGASMLDVGAELGYVKWGPNGVPEHSTLIKREPCQALADYLRSGKTDPTPDEVVAVHVLTHEAMHMKGITSEGLAECAAVQRDAETARLLGADPDAAIALARTYWTRTYPLMPDEYRSPGCAPGGELDEARPDSPWQNR